MNIELDKETLISCLGGIIGLITFAYGLIKGMGYFDLVKLLIIVGIPNLIFLNLLYKAFIK